MRPTSCGWCAAISGRVKMRMELVIRFGFGTDIPWVKKNEDGAGCSRFAGRT